MIMFIMFIKIHPHCHHICIDHLPFIQSHPQPSFRDGRLTGQQQQLGALLGVGEDVVEALGVGRA